MIIEIDQLGVDRGLAFQVLSMEPFDQLVRRLDAVVVGMVPVAEAELTACRGVRADAPTARLVAVELPHELVHGRSDRPDDAELGQV
jgi:hypothetical protein